MGFGYRGWALLGLAWAVASAVAGYQLGAHRVQVRWDQQLSADREQAARTDQRQAQATTAVVTQYVDRIQLVRQRGADIIKEVPIYVPTDSAAALPGGWRVLHDAAADGELPVPAERADAPAVAAQDAAAAVVGNYATCHANAEHLKALQQWVQAQQDAAP